MKRRIVKAVRAIRKILQSDGLACCDSCLAISPGGCSGLACQMSLLQKPRIFDPGAGREHVRPLKRRIGRLPLHGGATVDPDKLKRTWSLLPQRKKVSSTRD